MEFQSKKQSLTACNKIKKTRRGLKKRGYERDQRRLSILGNNCNGLKNKVESLKVLIYKFTPSIVTLQETMLKSKSLISLPGYEIFESLRCNKGGGGLLTAIDANLNPVLTSSFDNDDNIEILTVQLETGSHKIRVINAYGPQEDDGQEVITKFWLQVEQEIIDATDEGCCLILQLDANAKAGLEIIINDVNTMSGNGKLLVDMVDRHNLFIVNSWRKCKGIITRERITVLRNRKICY